MRILCSIRKISRSLKKQKTSNITQLKTFGSVWSEKACKEKIALYYYDAGHINGDGIIHFQHADVVHMGELVFNRRHPFVDRGGGRQYAKLDECTFIGYEKIQRENIICLVMPAMSMT